MDKAFEYLNDADRALLEKKGEVLEVEKDFVILEEGESRRVLFVILEGSCRVELSLRGKDETVANLTRNEFFGDMNFLEGIGASANVIANEPTKVLVITPEETQALLAADPSLAMRFYHSLAISLSRRLRATTNKLVEE
jgi:CRP-like cAMP-binding protein